MRFKQEVLLANDDDSFAGCGGLGDIGIIDLRHHIDHPVLGLWGGHIGYSIRPSERGKGYAKEMLRLNLEKCRERGMDKVMVTCSPQNVASAKTIIANGGVYEKDVHVDGKVIQRYWIEV